MIPVRGKIAEGVYIEASLLDAASGSTELELLRTVADGLGVKWGQDAFGWWAAVPQQPVSKFASMTEAKASPYALFREDDNGARFLISHFDSKEQAEAKAAELAYGGHKQHYFVEELPA